jgi:Tfp pilus assembly protein PilX
MMKRPLSTQAGIALPVMLIILLVMLISSIYLIKSSNTTTLTASNLAYDSAQSRAVDYALQDGFQWISSTARANKALLNDHVPASGYVAIYDAAQSVRSTEFWAGSRTVASNGQQVEYVIHRMCNRRLPYNDTDNQCVQTTDNPSAMGAAVAAGASLATDASRYTAIPRVHYLVMARLNGARGGNVVNQMVVLVGG